jgi:hypothetical protein
MAIHTLRPVARGEEFLLSYGKGFWRARAGPAGEDDGNEYGDCNGLGGD